MVTLLKALASGDTTGAKTDLAKLKTDLKAQEPTQTSGSSVTKDVKSLVKDLTAGNTSAAQTDVTKLQTDLTADGTSTSSSTQTANPLDTLVSNISDSLNSGNTQGALQALASYLVQNGQSTGGLVNTSA
jgi:hypothetical protein